MNYSSNPSQISHFQMRTICCRDARADLWEAVQSWRCMNLKIVSEAASSVTQRWLGSLRRDVREGQRSAVSVIFLKLWDEAFICLVLSAPGLLWENTKMDPQGDKKLSAAKRRFAENWSTGRTERCLSSEWQAARERNRVSALHWQHFKAPWLRSHSIQR